MIIVAISIVWMCFSMWLLIGLVLSVIFNLKLGNNVFEIGNEAMCWPLLLDNKFKNKD